MGVEFDRIATMDSAYVMPTYVRKPVLFVRGEGMRLYDDDGREYLDFVSGIGAVNLGHAHADVERAVCDQMSRLVHVSNWFFVEHRDELAEEVSRLLGGGMKLFFANSGTEAVEGAIKLARKWALLHKPGARTIVAMERSFHGRTLGALAATGQASKQESFEPLPVGFVHVPFNDISALDEAVNDSCAAVMLEVVQGEGGVWPASEAYLAAAQALCDERDALLIVDEVQSGFFRTGPAFAFQSAGLRPHVVTLAKALANGLPIGAVAARDDVADAFEPGDHGSTFGGGPVVCAAGRATVAGLQREGLGDNATATGRYMRAGLAVLAEASGAITDVRGIGLMCGVSLSEPVAVDIAARALDRGFVINHIGSDILRFLPPLVCGPEEVDELLTVLDDLLMGAVA